MSSSVADVCSSSRDGGGTDSGSVNSGGGDWICGDVTCHHSNFARRKQCNKCQRDRSQERSSSVGSSGSNKKKLGTEIGKAAAEKSRGLFSAEDWQCNKCANVNWARRSTCNMCNAPKFCENEERTGFGGGYNDRGVVEYKEREESDSEYDEFGRLKKKRNHSYNLDEKPQMVKTIKDKLIEEEEDDEEEDGDDDDLAKYNLFSDDEDVIPAKTTNSTKKESPKNVISELSNKIGNKSPLDRRSRSKNRSDVRRRQSRSSSSGGSSSSSSTTSSTSTSSSSSSSSSSSRSSFSDLSISRTLGSIKKRTYSNSRSRSRSPPKEAKRLRSPSKDTNIRKRSHNVLKTQAVKTEGHTGYSSKSRSKSRSSNHSSRSSSSKRKRSRSSKSSGKRSRSSAHSHRKRSTRSRTLTPKRKR